MLKRIFFSCRTLPVAESVAAYRSGTRRGRLSTGRVDFGVKNTDSLMRTRRCSVRVERQTRLVQRRTLNTASEPNTGWRSARTRKRTRCPRRADPRASPRSPYLTCPLASSRSRTLVTQPTAARTKTRKRPPSRRAALDADLHNPSIALRHYTPEVRAIRVQRNRAKRPIPTIVRVRAFTVCASEREVSTQLVRDRWVFTTR